MTDLPKTCAEAKTAGVKRYFTGNPCKHGHVTERITSSRACVECNRIKVQKSYAANPEKARERSRARYAENPETARERSRARRAANLEKVRGQRRARYAANPEAERARSRAWRAANLERKRERSCAWNAANPEAARKRARAWYAANPDAAAANSRNRRARKRSAEGMHTKADIARIAAAQKHRCAFCRTSIRKESHVDHIVALSKGGTNWPSNLQILCPPCNMRKYAKDPIDFAREAGRLL